MNEQTDQDQPSRWVTMYRVEVDHGGGWVRKHPAGWEETPDEAAAYTYADRLRDDHPGSGVRVLEEARVVGDHVVTEVGRDVRES